MPLRIDRSDQAEEDLLEIWHYIAPKDGAAADRLLWRILDTLNMLSEHPDIGRARPELGKGVRSFAVTENFGVFYSRTKSTLRLLRVLRFSRHITPNLFET